MNKKQLIVAWLIIIFLCPLTSEADVSISDLIPAKIEYGGRIYLYDSHWTDEENIVRGNLDNDPDEEVVVSFGTRTKDEEEVGIPVHFWQIYDLANAEYKPVKTTSANDYPGKIVLEDLNNDGRQEIVVFSHGGAHYTNVYIYQWQKEEYKEIWSNGSACGIVLGFDSSPSTIRVGYPNFGAKVITEEGKEIEWSYASEPLWQIYQWDGKRFVYSEKLSTTISER